jgi:hypothetical protein
MKSLATAKASWVRFTGIELGEEPKLGDEFLVASATAGVYSTVDDLA